MLKLIVACAASAADFHCYGVVPAGTGVSSVGDIPIEFCLKNDSGMVGSFRMPEKNADGDWVIAVSPNIHLCEKPIS